jgi:type IV fimbrial biogenesis protein FimT
MLQLRRRLDRGHTLIEVVVGLAILGIVLGVGIPNLTAWVITNKAKAASEFYLDGMSMARRQAVAHNARSRFVLTPNANGQYDWQIDLCFPVPATPCTDDAGNWSTTGAVASGDPEGDTGLKSVFRSATALPPADVLTPSVAPAAADSVYFTELGWVDTTIGARLTRLRLDPSAALAGSVRPAALSVTLAGMASKCDPTVASPDSRACPL